MVSIVTSSRYLCVLKGISLIKPVFPDLTVSFQRPIVYLKTDSNFSISSLSSSRFNSVSDYSRGKGHIKIVLIKWKSILRDGTNVCSIIFLDTLPNILRFIIDGEEDPINMKGRSTYSPNQELNKTGYFTLVFAAYGEDSSLNSQ